jgi:oligoribonuclease
MNKAKNLVWIDLEMTGLLPASDRIIEIATIVTDENLNLISEGPVLAIARVKASKIDEAEAVRQTLAFLAEYSEPKASPLCGNSICQDRRFMANYMPELEAFFHYRNLDVSTLKELANRWKPEIMAGLTKKATHQALDDIRESIEELRYYREHFIAG